MKKIRINTMLSRFCKKNNIKVDKEIYINGGSKWILTRGDLTLFYFTRTSELYKQGWRAPRKLRWFMMDVWLKKVFGIIDDIDNDVKEWDWITLKEMNRDGILKWENS